jgi:hypothetical protein
MRPRSVNSVVAEADDMEGRRAMRRGSGRNKGRVSPMRPRSRKESVNLVVADDAEGRRAME